MNIMELGAIGELVGGVAVIGSLIYVGFQVRQSTEQTRQSNAIERAHAAREVTDTYGNSMLMLRDPALLSCHRKALAAFDRLPGDEKTMADAYFRAHVIQVISIWIAGKEGLFDTEYAGRWVDWHLALIKTPGGAQWWNTAKASQVPEFVKHIDELVATRHEVPSLLAGSPWWGDDALAAEV